MLEDLGLRIVEEVPTRLQEHEGEGRYLHDFGVYGPDGSQLDLETLGPLVADAVGAVWDGRAESDSLNRLVPVAALSWREVSILRAYRQYRQVLGGGFTKRYQNDAFVRNGTVAKQLMELFALRLDFSARAGRRRRPRSWRRRSSPTWMRSPAWTTTASCGRSWA